VSVADHRAAEIYTANRAPCGNAVVAFSCRLAANGPASDQAGQRCSSGMRIAGRTGAAWTAGAGHFGSVDGRQANAQPTRTSKCIAVSDRSDLAGEYPLWRFAADIPGLRRILNWLGSRGISNTEVGLGHQQDCKQSTDHKEAALLCSAVGRSRKRASWCPATSF
jgi:hypothetical protein